MGIGICLGNNQDNFQLHRFIRRENTAKSFRGATFFDSHCTRNQVNVIYSDFQETFDKVPHNTQIQKRISHGTADSILIWIENWLKHEDRAYHSGDLLENKSKFNLKDFVNSQKRDVVQIVFGRVNKCVQQPVFVWT